MEMRWLSRQRMFLCFVKFIFCFLRHIRFLFVVVSLVAALFVYLGRVTLSWIGVAYLL